MRTLCKAKHLNKKLKTYVSMWFKKNKQLITKIYEHQ